LLFSPDEGQHLGPYVRVRRIVLPTNGPRLAEVPKLQRQLRRNGSFFSDWTYYRKYSIHELASADCFTFELSAVFEPVGEDCGTVYDESAACPYVFKLGEFKASGTVTD
jgi:hypothetical protein